MAGRSNRGNAGGTFPARVSEAPVASPYKLLQLLQQDLMDVLAVNCVALMAGDFDAWTGSASVVIPVVLLRQRVWSSSNNIVMIHVIKGRVLCTEDFWVMTHGSQAASQQELNGFDREDILSYPLFDVNRNISVIRQHPSSCPGVVRRGRQGLKFSTGSLLSGPFMNRLPITVDSTFNKCQQFKSVKTQCAQ